MRPNRTSGRSVPERSAVRLGAGAGQAAEAIIIATTLLTDGATRRVRLTALMPGVGGYLVLRRLRAAR